MCSAQCHDESGDYQKPANVWFSQANWACDDNAVPQFSFWWADFEALNGLSAISQTQAQSAWNSATTPWANASANISFSVNMFPSGYGSISGNGQNDIEIDAGRPPSSTSPSTMATTTCSKDVANNDPYQLVECDIVFYRENSQDGGKTYSEVQYELNNSNPSKYVLPMAMTHEIGHVLGLDDLRIGSPSDSIMWWEAQAGTNPFTSQRDKDAVLYLYGPQ